MKEKILNSVKNNSRRLFAKVIDGTIVLVLISIVHPLGPIVGLVYLLISDSLFNGQSIGKKLLDLKVISLKRKNAKCNYFESALRNAPFAVILILIALPILGWLLFATVGIAIILFETYLIVTEENGKRIGDILSNTKVVSLSK